MPSSHIRVGDVIMMPAGARVPADMVLLRTTDKSGAVFIRTDQLDGETGIFLFFVICFSENGATSIRTDQLDGETGKKFSKKTEKSFICDFL